MSLENLYRDIISRDLVDPKEVKRGNKRGSRVAILNQDKQYLDIMRVNQVGMGRGNIDVPMALIAVARVSSGQASMTLDENGEVRLNELEWLSGGDVYGNSTIHEEVETVGILAGYNRAHWAKLEGSLIYRITKREMKEIQQGLPSEVKTEIQV